MAAVGTPVQFLPDAADPTTVIAGIVRAMGPGTRRSLVTFPVYASSGEAECVHVDDAASGDPGWREIPEAP